MEFPRFSGHYLGEINRAAARIKLGLQNKLFLGNLEARRDWGLAGDYVEAMLRMLQHEPPDDYVITTGEAQCADEFCEEAFGLDDLDWTTDQDGLGG